MLLTTHALAGAAIGKTFNNIGLIIIISIALHFLLDTVRHGEYLNQKSKWNEFWKVAIDVLIGLSVLGIVIYFSDFSRIEIRNILIGSFFSMLPDLLTLLNWKLRVKLLKGYYDFHTRLHKYPPFSKERCFNFKNAINDIIFSLTAIILLLL